MNEEKIARRTKENGQHSPFLRSTVGRQYGVVDTEKYFETKKFDSPQGT